MDLQLSLRLPQKADHHLQHTSCNLFQVGPTNTASSWKVREVGDGNINFVYIVEGPVGALCVKQSLPFVRCVGDSWPLTQVGLECGYTS